MKKALSSLFFKFVTIPFCLLLMGKVHALAGDTTTNMRIKMLTGLIAVTPPAREGRGTVPDYIVPNNIRDILSGTDTQLNFIDGLIRKSNQR